MSKNTKAKIAAAIILSTMLTSTVSATVITLHQQGTGFDTEQGQQALTGFEYAADFWGSLFSDDITVNLNIGFADLGKDYSGANIIGSTSLNTVAYYYQDVANAMIGDVTSTVDVQAVNSLTCEWIGICARSFLDIEDGDTVLDNDATPDNYVMALTQANAKALGLSTDYFYESDASITFSNTFAFDFDDSDGIDNDKIDFIGMAIHEIGHALGFISGVDGYDYYNALGWDSDYSYMASTLDLFRYSAESVAEGVGVLDFRPGAQSYFSLDGGATSLGLFSTGSYLGDGQQASHWKDNLGLGIMDPTLADGEFAQVNIRDLIAFDAIGWDLAFITDVPEPTSITLFGLAAVGLFTSRRKKLSVST